MEAEEVTAAPDVNSAGSSPSRHENVMSVHAFGQPALLYAAHTVPSKAWETFTHQSSDVLRRVVSTAASWGQEHFAARHERLKLASRLLHTCSASRRRAATVFSSIQRVEQGEVQRARVLSTAQQHAVDQRTAHRVHQSMQQGNI
jgi:hypothetical protein